MSQLENKSKNPHDEEMTREDWMSSGWFIMAKEHWKKYRPKVVAALTEEELDDQLIEAVQEARKLEEQLRKQSYSAAEAMSLAEREYLILPDYDDSVDEEPDEPDEYGRW